MGEYRDTRNIKHYEPDNSDNTLYIRTSDTRNITMDELLEKIQNHFGDVSMSNLAISSEYIHTRCITYDKYDPGDYDNFIVIERIPS